MSHQETLPRLGTPNGQRIKALRVARMDCNTQKELAHAAGIGIRTLRLIENQSIKFQMQRLRQIAKALGVPVDYILEQVQRPPLASVKSPECREPIFSEIPRMTEIVLFPVSSAKALLEGAELCQKIEWRIDVDPPSDVLAYVEELLRILKQEAGVSVHEIADAPYGLEFPSITRLARARELLVLLKGNDVLIYAESYFRHDAEIVGEGGPYKIAKRQAVVFASHVADSVYAIADNGLVTPADSNLF